MIADSSIKFRRNVGFAFEFNLFLVSKIPCPDFVEREKIKAKKVLPLQKLRRRESRATEGILFVNKIKA